MNTKRLVVLVAVLAAGFGSIFLLPASTDFQPMGVRLELPNEIGIWEGKEEPIAPKELEVLAPDTEFARKSYRNFAHDSIFASVVLSGRDLDNSIHRPERCLPAQGWTVVDSRAVVLKTKDGQGLEAMRLLNVKSIRASDGQARPVYSLNYYWFVGHNRLTNSHLERTFMDIQDRVLRGYNQRWAYVTVAATITEGFVSFGRSEKETDAMLQKFIQELGPHIMAEPNLQASVQTR